MQHTSLSAQQIRTLATLKATASRDDTSPIITGIQLTATPYDLTAYATDRYRVAEYTSTLATDDALTTAFPRTDFAAIIPPALLDRVVKVLPKHVFATATIAVMHDEEKHEVTFSSTVGDPFAMTSPTISGNYPPLARLFPADGETFEAEGLVRLNSGHLAAVDKLRIHGVPVAHRTWDIGFRKPEPGSRAQQAVLFTTTDGQDTIRALAQPNYQR